MLTERAAGPPQASGALLGFAAGFADTAGYLGLDGLFTAHVTGNLVVLGARLANQQSEAALLRVALIPLFGAAIAGSYFFVQRAKSRGRSASAPLLLAESLCLAGSAVAGFALRHEVAEHATSAMATVAVLAVVGMGIQNAMMRVVYAGQAQTTVMTGNLTQLVVDLASLVSHGPGARDLAERTAAIARLHKVGGATGGFVLGAVAGAALTHALGLASLAVPALVVLWLAMRDLRQTSSAAGAIGPGA